MTSVQKLAFSCICLDTYEKLNYVGTVVPDNFCSNLKRPIILKEEHETFLKEFCERKCTAMNNWLREYNFAV